MEYYNTRNKNYKDGDHRGYTINVGSFDIAGVLERYRLTDDDKKSLLTTGIQKNYIIIITDGATLVTDGKEISASTTDTSPVNERLKDILVKH